MFLEFDWTFNVYRTRFGDRLTSWCGHHSFPSRAEANSVLRQTGYKIGRRVDTRSWRIEAV